MAIVVENAGTGADSGVLDAAVTIAGALARFDEAGLLARTQEGRRDQDILRGPVSERLPLAMALALLRPLRLLGLTGAGPRCVGELPFGYVHRAIKAALDLAENVGSDAAPSLPDWLARQGLEGWVIDAAAWRRRLSRVRRGATSLPPAPAFELCVGRVVAASRMRELDRGPLDGAVAIELILEDATVLLAPTSTRTDPLDLLGTRASALGVSNEPTWHFEDCHDVRTTLALIRGAEVVVQASPVHDGAMCRAYF